MTARADRTLALIAGGLLALLFSGCFAVQVADWTVGRVERSAHRVIPGPVTELTVRAGGGDVTVLAAHGGDVTIDSRSAGSLSTPPLGVDVEGSSVEVAGGCAGMHFGRCRADIVVHVPAGVAVRVDAASGDVTADGLSGNADLRTASGDVHVHALRGRAELETSSGDVDGAALASDSVRAHSSSGDVELRFADAPETVEAQTESGDARISVPRGRETYRVELETSNGDREYGVHDDARSTRLLRARTTSGDATVDYAG